MKVRSIWGVVLMVVLAAPVFAEDQFDVGYRHEDVTVEENMMTGKLLVSVYNVSGADVRDVTISIPGPNTVTYDSRMIFIGNLSNGQRVEILDLFRVPVEVKQADSVDDQTGIDLEFTTKAGERKKTWVTARNVQIKK